MEREMTTAEMVEVLRGAASIMGYDWPQHMDAIADRLEALDKVAKAQARLCVCYRLGKQPSDEVLDALSPEAMKEAGYGE